jgi:hypothetical protein
MRSLIRIEEFRCGKNLAQALAKSRFPSGNSTCDPDSRHLDVYDKVTRRTADYSDVADTHHFIQLVQPKEYEHKITKETKFF